MVPDWAVVRGFEWDAGNLGKNQVRHGITTAEAEQLFLNAPLVADDEKHSTRSEQRWLAYGTTDAGVLLVSAFTVRGDRIRVISARRMNTRERRLYAARREAEK